MDGHKLSGLDEVDTVEKNINNYIRIWAKFLKLGAKAGEGQSKRCSDALVVKRCNVPTLKGQRKDHKKNWDPNKGPPMRPLCDAKQGPNAPL